VRLRIETSTDSVLNRSGPEWSFYQRSQALFGGDEIVVVAIEGESSFDPALFEKVRELTDALEGLPGVRRVDSLASVPVVSGRPDGALDLSPALKGTDLRAPGSGEAVRQKLNGDRVAPRSLISDAGEVAAVNVLLDEGADGHYDALFAGIDSALNGRRAAVSGVPIFRVAATASTRGELLLFVPITISVIGLLLFLVFGSLRAVCVPLLTCAAGSAVPLGVMGAIGNPLTLTTAILPSVVLALGCTYTLHLLTAARGATTPQELEAALEPVALPVALSGLTTAIGFVAISVVRIDAIRFLGAYGALGVLSVLALTMTATPAALALWPLPRDSRFQWRLPAASLADWLVRLARDHWRVVLAGWVILLILCGSGLPKIRVETDATRWFSPGHPIRDAYERIREELSGISPMNVVIEAEGEVPVTSPPALSAIDGLAQHLAGLPHVGKVLSLADPLRQLHGGFLGDPTQPLPTDRALAEQYLLLLESVEQLGDLVTPDRRAANVVLRLDDNGSSYLLDVAAEALGWWEAHGPPGFRARTTGVMFEFARALDEISRGQILGLTFAGLAIAAILYAILRRAPLAVVAMVPNAAPVLVIFGVMGTLDLAIDAGTVLVGSFALGVAVDDTIHIVTAYDSEQARGADGPSALRRGLVRVLPAVVYTTVIVSAGFAVLALSDFALTASVMVLCLLADLTLLPALLLRVEESDSARTP
jgi:hypothetical protein